MEFGMNGVVAIVKWRRMGDLGSAKSALSIIPAGDQRDADQQAEPAHAI